MENRNGSASMNKVKEKKNILLTGAGFSANFGGCLGSQMWTRIFSSPEVQNHKKLVYFMKQVAKGSGQTDYKILDFESVYTQVLKVQNFGQAEKDAMIKAVENAYSTLQLSMNEFSKSPNIDLATCMNNLVNPFLIDGNHFFTLNQDLFIEQNTYLRTNILWPGINHSSFNSDDASKRILIPETYSFSDLDLKKKSYYIKLHGSLNWYSSEGNEKIMVIGRTKENEISNFKLLSEYFKIFKNLISDYDVKILIIGYGFMDEHINEILRDGITKHGLKIYVLDPTSVIEFNGRLRFQKNFSLDQLWDGLCGYFQHKLADLFPPGQTETRLWIDMKRAFFE